MKKAISSHFYFYFWAGVLRLGLMIYTITSVSRSKKCLGQSLSYFSFIYFSYCFLFLFLNFSFSLAELLLGLSLFFFPIIVFLFFLLFSSGHYFQPKQGKLGIYAFFLRRTTTRNWLKVSSDEFWAWQRLRVCLHCEMCGGGELVRWSTISKK